jgi:dihydroneopterin aldolase
MTQTIIVKVEKLKLDWFIGIYDFEYEKPQSVVIDIDMEALAPKFDGNEDYEDVVCYKTIVDEIKKMRDMGHIRLVETLADKICNLCLNNKKVMNVTVSVSKIQAIDEVQGVGVKLHKKK